MEKMQNKMSWVFWYFQVLTIQALCTSSFSPPQIFLEALLAPRFLHCWHYSSCLAHFFQSNSFGTYFLLKMNNSFKWKIQKFKTWKKNTWKIKILKKVTLHFCSFFLDLFFVEWYKLWNAKKNFKNLSKKTPKKSKFRKKSLCIFCSSFLYLSFLYDDKSCEMQKNFKNSKLEKNTLKIKILKKVT